MATTTSAPEPSDRTRERRGAAGQADPPGGGAALLGRRRRPGSPRPCSGASSAARPCSPTPSCPRPSGPAVEAAVAAVRAFADAHIDAAAIDREADIPASVIEGLADLGVLGMAAPVEWGGRGFSQMGYCRIMEVIGGHCASTAVFVNAHHSIGLRALVLFGTPEQKARWLPPLARGEKLAAFALTEEQAGSDASNVQTTATPVGGRPDLHPERQQALHHQRRHRRRADRDGPHARPARGRVEGHGVPGHARHARLRGRRGADAQVRHPRHRHGPAGLPRHARAGDEHPRPARQGAEGRADGARLRPDDLRRQLHGAGQGLPGRRRRATPPAAASSAGRSPTSS